MPRRLIALFLIVFFASPVVAELELDDNELPKRDMLKAFEQYTGRWVGVFKMKDTDFVPEPFEITGAQEGKYILDGTMFQMRGIGETDEGPVESLFLYGYDRLEESYCCWHYQQGGIAMKYKVEWAEDGKSYTHSLIDSDEFGYSVKTNVQLDNGKAIRWTSEITTNEGDLIIDQTGELTPEQGEVEFPEPGIKEDDKLTMYRSYAGRWESVTKGKATEVVEEPYEVDGNWVQRSSLGGDVVFMEGVAKVEGAPYKYQWFCMYDVREEAYVTWFHDSRGVHTKMYGSWSETKKQMTWTLDAPDKHGVMVTIVDDISDPDKISFTFKMEANDGTLILEEAGYATRSKEK